MKYAITGLLIIGLGLTSAFAQPGEAPSTSETERAPVTVTPTTGAQIPSAAPRPQTPRLPSYMEEANGMEQTTVEWYENEHDFGKIVEGEVATYTYKFKNVGEHPLKLVRVKASCGCTTPSYSKEEIAPGEEGMVQIAFNTSHKVGFQNKAVTVTGNFPGTNQILRFKGEVVKPEAEQAPAVEAESGI